MGSIFSQVLNMSLTGSVVIVLVMVVRLLLKRSPKIYSYLLWAVVLFRLLSPVSISASISVLDVLNPEVVQPSQGISAVSYPVEAAQPVTYIPAQSPEMNDSVQTPVPDSVSRTPDTMSILAWVWTAGAVVLILYSSGQYLALQKRLVGAMRYRGNVFVSDYIDTAFVMGLVQPKIYLPSGVPHNERKYIIAHERHHIRRWDHVIKLLAYGALCIHWFNPLVWAAFILAGKDMEMSCDEAVIRKLGTEIRAEYSASLLRLTTHKKIISGMPLAFGEGDTKGRVLNMSRWKKPKVWVSLICLLICTSVLFSCAVNPEEKVEDLTEVHGPASIGVGNLYFTLPDGLTISTRESQVQPKGELFRHENVIRKDGEIVGGVYKLRYPNQGVTGTWEWVEKLNVPENVPEDRLMMSIEPADGKLLNSMTVYYGKNGVSERIHYLFNGDQLVYDLWFDMEQLSEDEKNEILDSVKFENSSWDGKLRLTLPEGLYFSQDKQGNLIFTDGLNKIGGKQVYAAPAGYDYYSRDFMVALGLPEATDETLGHSGGGSGLSADGYGIEYFSDVPPGEKRDVHTYHQFYTMSDGKTIYDIWFNLLYVDPSVKDAIIGSIEIPEIGKLPQSQSEAVPMPTIPAGFPFDFSELPAGFVSDILGENCVLFTNTRDVVGGIDVFPIPEGVYDPGDKAFIWLEDVGIPDFEDQTLCYMGGMTYGSIGWFAEFASDVPEGVEPTVQRRHHFYPIGGKVYDIWFDMMLIDYRTSEELLSSIKMTAVSQPEPDSEISAEDIAMEKARAVIDAVAEGGCTILQTETSGGNEGPKGYERVYHFTDGNLLYISTMHTEGENRNEAGEYHNRYALLYAEDTFYDNTATQGQTGEIQWQSAQPPETIPVPWLGNRAWVKHFVTYIDTLTNDNGTCYMFRYDAKYEDREDCASHYWVNFYFDPEGNFRYVQIDVNLMMENAFTITESIVTMDADAVRAVIEKEYKKAIS